MRLHILPQTNLSNKCLDGFLTNCNIKAVYRTTNTIQKYVHKNYKNAIENKACIYEIPCQDCSKTYIGETNDFERRRRQHRDSLRRGDTNSALFQHRNDFDHAVRVDEMKKIINIKNVEKRRLLESILIQNVDSFNIYKSNFKFDLFSNAIITKNVLSVAKLLSKMKKPP